MTAFNVLATARGSGEGEDSGISTWMAESAPMANAVRRVSSDLGGPIVMALIDFTWSLRRSRRRIASSTAFGNNKTKVSQVCKNENETSAHQSRRKGSVEVSK